MLPHADSSELSELIWSAWVIERAYLISGSMPKHAHNLYKFATPYPPATQYPKDVFKW